MRPVANRRRRPVIPGRPPGWSSASRPAANPRSPAETVRCAASGRRSRRRCCRRPATAHRRRSQKSFSRPPPSLAGASSSQVKGQKPAASAPGFWAGRRRPPAAAASSAARTIILWRRRKKVCGLADGSWFNAREKTGCARSGCDCSGFPRGSPAHSGSSR